MFTCDKCEKLRCGDLFHSGVQKKTCKICNGWKDHRLKSKNPLEFESFKRSFIFRKEREWLSAMSLRRCLQCEQIKSINDKWHSSGSICWDCVLWRKKNKYYSIERRRKTYNSENKNRRKTGMTREQYIESRKKPPNQDEHVKEFRRWLIDASHDEKGDHWQRAGMPWRDRRLPTAERYRLRYMRDVKFATKERMRRQVTKAKKRDGISDVIRRAIRNGGRSNRVERELGYSISQLCDHLERQFTKGMTWQAFQDGEIHIDHIIPQKSFDLTNPAEWRACWALSNLRPCWASENLRKGGKCEFLI